MKALFGVVLASALTLPVAEAMADVVYDLQETVHGNPGFEGTLTLPGFVSTDTTYPVAEFSVSNNPSGFANIEFDPSSTSFGCSFYVGPPCDFLSLTHASGLGADDYGYAPGTFSKTGQNTATLDSFSMELTVSQTGAVPEPSTWAMMLVGFAGLGFAGYRASHRPVQIAA